MTDTTKQPQPDTAAQLQPLSAEERETWTAVARQRGRWHDHLAANLLAEPFLRLLAERDALAEREELQKRARGDPECPLCGATNCAHRERWDFAALRDLAINRRQQIAQLTAAKEQAEREECALLASYEQLERNRDEKAERIAHLEAQRDDFQGANTREVERRRKAEMERDDADAISRELTSTTVAMIQEREQRIAEMTAQAEISKSAAADTELRLEKAEAYACQLERSTAEDIAELTQARKGARGVHHGTEAKQ